VVTAALAGMGVIAVMGGMGVTTDTLVFGALAGTGVGSGTSAGNLAVGGTGAVITTLAGTPGTEVSVGILF